MKNDNFIQGKKILWFEKNEFILLLMMYLKSPSMKIQMFGMFVDVKKKSFYIFEIKPFYFIFKFWICTIKCKYIFIPIWSVFRIQDQYEFLY